MSEELGVGVGEALSSDATREVDGFTSLVTDRALHSALRKSTDVTRYRLVGRRLYRFPRARTPDKAWLVPTEQGFEGWLTRLIGLVPAEVEVPDMEFGANLGDYPVRGAPILTWWSCNGYGNARMPSGVHWQEDPAVPFDDPTVRGDRRFDATSLERPWAERENRVVWRGSATGMYDRTFRGWRVKVLLGRPLGRGIARLDLAHIGEVHPSIIDAKLVDWPQLSGLLRRRLQARYGRHPRVPRTWYLRHRYVINIDGNVATSSFLTFLGSGSAVLKQESPYLDWCGERLRPREHYLPFARDLSDLVPVAQDALAHPERGAEIARAGRDFAERFLTGAAVDYYMLALLERYATVAPRPTEPGRGAIEVG
jgi:hypothetical protein